MAKVAIRPVNSAKHAVLDEKYTVEDVVASIEEASSAGKRVVLFEANGDGYVAVSVGGTEPYTIRELSESGGARLL